ncbi:MAG TPA: FAD-dependent oxidoreductase [Phycisphaerae bacterium]|nr:FAD-dependent oxidoreductase [Phycisphaerae bacterium]HNU43884.1 FAD-dependent oxidoreductase [Phycisphaerae bacterium]
MATKLVIVGGVAAGAAAATRARRLDEFADIIIFERSGYVSFASCGLPYHVGRIIPRRASLLITSPERFREWFNIDVRVRHEVLSIDRVARRVRVRDLESGREFDEPYDKLILTPGASAVVPPIDGSASRNVFVLRTIEDMDALNAYLDERPVRRVAVVGAGFIGLEATECLCQRGLEVDLIELLPQVLPPLDADLAPLVESHLRAHGVRLHLGAGLESFALENGHVAAVGTRAGRSIPTDAVLVSVGVRPNNRLARDAGLELTERGAIRVNDRLETSDPSILAAGDVIEAVHAVTGVPVSVPLAGPAARQGRLAGQRAVGFEGPPAARVAGTAIVEVFDLVVAVTGLGLQAARRAGPPCAQIIARRLHHVDYYPGAQPMTIKLVYAPDTGRLLGGQIVGGAGVDRRIDVLATALHFGGTVDDVADLDLAYAPQFGAAKDPVVVAAQIAQNERSGLIQHVDPAELEGLCRDGAQLVDARPAAAAASSGAIPGAVQIPMATLRQRLETLDRSRPVVLYCDVGYTSYLAARVLRQRGFPRVYNLAGGFRWYVARGLPVVSTG